MLYSHHYLLSFICLEILLWCRSVWNKKYLQNVFEENKMLLWNLCTLKNSKKSMKTDTSINGTSSFVSTFKIVTHYVALDYNYFSWSKDIHVINEMKSNETIESLFTLHLITIFIFVIYFFIKRNWKYLKYWH